MEWHLTFETTELNPSEASLVNRTKQGCQLGTVFSNTEELRDVSFKPPQLS